MCVCMCRQHILITVTRLKQNGDWCGMWQWAKLWVGSQKERNLNASSNVYKLWSNRFVFASLGFFLTERGC